MSDRHEPLKAAVVGAGLMGRWHSAYLRRSGGRITAVIDPNRGAASRLAGGSARVFADLSSALAAERCDVVHICTPTDSHVPLIQEALEAGCHVLAEKPIARGARETQRLLDQAAAAGRLLCPVHQMPFQEGARRAAQRLTDLGEIAVINFTIRSAGGEGRSPDQIDAIAREILPHPLSLLKRLLGIDLAGLHWVMQAAGVGEIRASAACGSRLIDISISMSARPTMHRCEIAGAHGTVSIDLFHGTAIWHPGRVSRWDKIAQPFAEAGRTMLGSGVNLVKRTLRREPAYPGLLPLMRQFYDAARSGASTPIAPAEVIDIAETCERIEQGIGS